MQIIQRQLDKLSALCTFGTRAYRDIFPRPELFSSTTTYSTQVLERSNEEEALQRRFSPPFSSAHQGTRVDRIVDQYPLAAVSTESTLLEAPSSRKDLLLPVLIDSSDFAREIFHCSTPNPIPCGLYTAAAPPTSKKLPSPVLPLQQLQ